MTFPNPIYSLFILSIPAIAALVCLVFLCFPFPIWKQKGNNSLRKALILYYLIIVINWVISSVIVCSPEVLPVLRSIILFTCILAPLALYYFIFTLTKANNKETFSLKHLIPVLLLFVFVTGLSICIPTEVQKNTNFLQKQSVPGYEILDYTIVCILLIRFLYGALYTILSIRRFFYYRRNVVDYSANLSLDSLSWLRTFLIIIVALIIIPMALILVPHNEIISRLSFFIITILFLIQYIILCFHMIQGNFIYMGTEDNPDMDKSTDFSDLKQNEPGLTLNKLIEYMASEKPYLNPQLKITDMITPLQTNRSDLSALINNCYKMNFSRFINEYRLQELYNINNNPDMQQLNNFEKITQAGFGSYQSYYRAKKQHEDNLSLKAD